MSITSTMAAQITVRITTVRGVDDLPEMHYVAYMRGDQVLVPIRPGPLSEFEAETEAAVWASVYGVPVSRRDADEYDPQTG